MVVSGTVTLQVARQHRPMVVIYKYNWWFYQCVARWIVNSRFYTLPNLIAGEEVVPELVPHFGDHGVLAARLAKLLDDPGEANRQRAALRRICASFGGMHAAEESARQIAAMAGLGAGERA